MVEQINNTNNENEFFRSLTIIVRRYIFLILAIIMFAFAIGIVCAQTRKPYYVASEPIVYDVIGMEDGATSSGNEEKYGFAARRLLLKTIVDFCRQGIVLDRAEYYYEEFTKLEDKSSQSLQTFIEEVESNQKYVYDAKTHAKEKRVHFGKETVVSSNEIESSDEEAQNMTFTISVKDENVTAAKDKLRMIALAANMELKYNTELFPKMKNSITELGAGKELGRAGISTYCTLSKSKIVISAGLIGIVCSVVLAIVLYYTDNTVKERYELENLTGTSLLANIEMVEGV